MNSFELNKVLGAVLGTCLFLVAMHIASGAIFTPEPPAKPGYVIEVKEEQPAQGAAAAPAEVPIEQMLASASAEQGHSDAKVCLTCHNFGKGEGVKTGPDLYGIVGRPRDRCGHSVTSVRNSGRPAVNWSLAGRHRQAAVQWPQAGWPERAQARVRPEPLAEAAGGCRNLS